MKCKYCNFDGVSWPENYTPGCRLIEVETGTEHTRERCDDLKNGNVRKTDGWIKRLCKCRSMIFYSRKHYTEKTVEDCWECKNGNITKEEYGRVRE